jgi:2Fe-2S type ferredoxin
MVDLLAVSIGALLTLSVVVLHFSRGTERPIPEDISQEVIERRAATVAETDFPEPMNRGIGSGGVATAAIAGEAGTEGELEEGAEEVVDDDPSAIPDEEAEVFQVEYVNEGTTIEVKENETLLEAGEDEGWDLPYACREGQCISCGGRITNGPAEDYVEHHTNGMLGEPELEDGYTLTCVAYPIADLSLETRESP